MNPWECAGCGAMFRALSLFDGHRVGVHGLTAGDRRRRCMSAEEMAAKGWRLVDGVWRGAPLPTGVYEVTK